MAAVEGKCQYSFRHYTKCVAATQIVSLVVNDVPLCDDCAQFVAKKGPLAEFAAIVAKQLIEKMR